MPRPGKSPKKRARASLDGGTGSRDKKRVKRSSLGNEPAKAEAAAPSLPALLPYKPSAIKKHSFLIKGEERKRGFLVSCGRPSQAVPGLLWLLQKVTLELYREEIAAWKAHVAELLAAHAGPSLSLERVTGRTLKFYQVVASGCKGITMLVIRMPPRQPQAEAGSLAVPRSPTEDRAWSSFGEMVLRHISPVAVIKALMADLVATHASSDGGLKAIYGQHCALLDRILPLDVIVPATMADIIEAARPIVVKHLPSTGPCIRYAILVSIRSNTTLQKNELITAVGELVGTNHIVDLSSPTLCVVVQVSKEACGVSVVDNYYAYRKLNMKRVLDKGTAKACR